MNKHLLLSTTLLAAAALTACSTAPVSNASLDEARSSYRSAQDNPQIRELAGGELKQAEDALNKANDAWARKDDRAEVDHLAYLAKQRVAIAEETARQKAAESTISTAEAARDKVRLEARTREAEKAQRSAESALRQSAESQRQSAEAQRQSAASRQEASDAQARASRLEAQLKDLDAKKTDRGLVITIGDVFFDSNKAQLKAGGVRSVEKLAAFLKEFPQRKVLIEGFTDSSGGDRHNLQLSSQRADAVRTALVGMGVEAERIATRGYGKEYPVAGNASSSGRQLNRRVEIILSDDSGKIAPR
ncbi:MAG: OmpA family protein [Zoogloea sp.]|nr:OmpA family protein [Zoogloea sp.]